MTGAEWFKAGLDAAAADARRAASIYRESEDRVFEMDIPDAEHEAVRYSAQALALDNFAEIVGDLPIPPEAYEK